MCVRVCVWRETERESLGLSLSVKQQVAIPDAVFPDYRSQFEGAIIFFLEKNDVSFAVKCAPPAAGFLHKEGHCQDVREEGNAGVSRWNAWFTSNHAAGISISHHFDTIIFSRKFLWHFFSRENSCSNYFLEKIHVMIFFSRKFL